MQLTKTEGQVAAQAIATTTTAQAAIIWQSLPNPCKFRGHTIEILEALYDCGALTTKEISVITGLSVKYIGDRCREGQKTAIFVKVDRWKYMITEYGEYVFKINNNKIKVPTQSSSKQEQIPNEYLTNAYPTLHSSKKPRQLNLSLFSELENLPLNERTVVEVMVKHYEKSGRPYYLVRDYLGFRDEIELPTKLNSEDIADILIRLENAGFLYNVRKGEGRKIGILKQTIQAMQYC